MYDMRQQAKKSQDAKLRSYGGKSSDPTKKYADGGRVHDDVKEDKALIAAKVKPECLKRADGGPIASGTGSKLGRSRKGGKKGGKTNISIILGGKPGGDSAPAALPPALGAAPGVNLAPKPAMPAGPGPAIPPAAMPRPPMKCGGSVKKK